MPELKGRAILDNNGQNRQDRDDGALKVRYWKCDEAENYFVTPGVLRWCALSPYPADDLFFAQTQTAVDEALTEVLTDFGNVTGESGQRYRAVGLRRREGLRMNQLGVPEA